QAVVQYEWEPRSNGPNAPWGGYRLKRVVHPDGKVTQYQYPATVLRQDPDHGVKDAVVVVELPPVTPVGSVTPQIIRHRTEFDTTHPTLDAQGRQAAVVGQVLLETDGNDVTTEYAYDSYGTLTGIDRFAAASGGALGFERLGMELTVNRLGDVTQRVFNHDSPLELTENYTYDGQGKLLTTSAIVNGQAFEQKFYYDALGHMVVHLRTNQKHDGTAPDDLGPMPRSDQARAWLRDEYHYLDDRLVVTLRDRRALDRDEDPADPLFDDRDARFSRTDYSWNPQGWLLQVAEVSGAVTNFTYDGYGSLFKTEVVGGNSTPLLVGKRFLNDAFELVRHVRGEGAEQLVTTMDRNPSGRITKVVEPRVARPGSWYPGNPVDPGYLPYQVLEFDYNEVGQLTETRVLEGGSLDLLLTRRMGYDEIGRRESVLSVDPSGEALLSQTTWTDLSKPTQVTLPDGLVIEREFDWLGRLVEVRQGQGSNPDKVRYSYYPNTGECHGIDDYSWDQPSATYVNRMVTYVKDSMLRTLEVQELVSAGAPAVHKFRYYTSGATESYTDPSGKVHQYLADALGRHRETLLPGAQPIFNETTYADFTGIDDRSEVLRSDGRGRA
ncbi:MAG: hypothetical protein P8N02_05605, partial [Actinomycetota bacterium]|nr:hypothetical protein [Actinomycetota bacterium]